VLVRFADDLVVMCHSKREAEAALNALRSILTELGLEPKAAKTRIVYLQEEGEGLDFLGFHHRRVHGEHKYRHLRFLARWPSREAMQRARNRIREITDSKRLRDPIEVIVQELNRFLRGWANYFRYGNSRLHFTRITTVWSTVALTLANRAEQPSSAAVRRASGARRHAFRFGTSHLVNRTIVQKGPRRPVEAQAWTGVTEWSFV
jgi:RNA-directed DNA polymerase